MPKRAAAAVDLVQPKGPLNAYMMFANNPTTKETAKDELPVGHTNKEIISKCGELWRGLSEEDKKPWNVRADADKARHTKKMEAFLKAGGVKNERKSKKGKGSADASPSSSSTKKKGAAAAKSPDKGKGKGKAAATATPVKQPRAPRDPTKPVVPGGAFDLFVKGESESEGRKEELAEMYKKDVRALLKKEWEAMDEEEQKVWKDQAKTSNKDYKLALTAWQCKQGPPAVVPISPATTTGGAEKSDEEEEGEEEEEEEGEDEEEDEEEMEMEDSNEEEGEEEEEEGEEGEKGQVEA